MTPTRLLVTCSAAIVATLLTGCSAPSTDSASAAVDSTVSTPSEDATTADLPAAESPSPAVAGDNGVDAPCELLDEATVSRVVGVEIEERVETSVGGIPACLWGTMGGAGLQVASVPAEVWGASVPGLLDELQSVGPGLLGEEDLQKLDEAQGLVAGGKLLTAEQSCGIFSTMLELNGHAAGSDFGVSYIPDGDAPQAVSGQACVDGRYHSLLVMAPQLEVSAATEARVVDVLSDLVDG